MQNHNSLENVEYGDSMETEMLKQFRRNLSDVLRPGDTDAVLLKWLRAKNFHLQKSETIYRENAWLRELYQLDHLEETWEIPEVAHKYGFSNHIGIAKDGTPVNYVVMGRGDFRGFLMCMDSFNIPIYCSYTIEAELKICKEQSKKLGKDINEITYIIDMEGFCLRQFFNTSILEQSLDLLRMLQDGYPEVWKHILIVNAPSYTSTIFSFIKPILRYTFFKDFQVVSREHTARLLLKYVDAEVLPAFLGGTRVDSEGSPMCKGFLKFGGPIPEEYFLRNYPLLQPTDVGADEMLIRSKSCYNYPFVIRQADSVIRFEFRTEGGSINMSLLFRKFGPDPNNPDLPSSDEYLSEQDKKCNVELISPHSHIQAHLSQVNHHICAVRPGIYIFKFDNSYNWLTSRKLIYRFSVQPPQVSCPPDDNS